MILVCRTITIDKSDLQLQMVLLDVPKVEKPMVCYIYRAEI